MGDTLDLMQELGTNDYRYEPLLKYFASAIKKDAETGEGHLNAAKAAADVLDYHLDAADKFKAVNKYSKLDLEKLKKVFVDYLRNDLDHSEANAVVDSLGLNLKEFHTMHDDGAKEFHKLKADHEEGFETEDYCPSCLEEYLLEYADKIEEAEYKGRKVSLGKPFLTPGGPKKRSVYVKNQKGNVVKVNFGDPNMKIKKSNPKRRKSFRARHHCENPGPRWKARYWSCKAW